jgi:hypothetical protein
MNEYVELPIGAAEAAELIDIVVRQCGCGCVASDWTLRTGAADCTAGRTLRDRRFVLGIVFARTLRHQLEDEEWRRARAQTSVTRNRARGALQSRDPAASE